MTETMFIEALDARDALVAFFRQQAERSAVAGDQETARALSLAETTISQAAADGFHAVRAEGQS